MSPLSLAGTKARLKLLTISITRPTSATEYENIYPYSDSFVLELITGENSITAQQPPEAEQERMRGTTGTTHLGVRVRDLEGAVMIGETLEVTSETTEIVYVADKVPSNIRYARKRCKKPWRIAVSRDPDGLITELVER